MTDQEVLKQLVDNVLPLLIDRVKHCEQSCHETSQSVSELHGQLGALREHIYDDAARVAALSDRVTVLEAASTPKKRGPRKKKAEPEPEVVLEQVPEAQPGATDDPLDMTIDELDFLDTVYRQVGGDVDAAVNVFGVDRDNYARYVRACK